MTVIENFSLTIAQGDKRC